MLSPNSTTLAKMLKLYPKDKNFEGEKLLVGYGW
jgi:hypothetical protein